MTKDEIDSYLDYLEVRVKSIDGDEASMRNQLKEIAQDIINDMHAII